MANSENNFMHWKKKKKPVEIFWGFNGYLEVRLKWYFISVSSWSVFIPSHTTPRNPWGQLHLNAPEISVHVAPFLQGLEAQ